MPKTITLTDETYIVTLTREEAEQIGNAHQRGRPLDSSLLFRMYKQLDKEFQQSDQELRIKMLRGEWLPKRDEFYKPVDKRTGEIKSKDKAAFDFHLNTDEAYAPPDLAEELSQVIQGKWLPKKGDDVFACSRDNLQTFYKKGKYSETYRFTADKDFEGNASHYDRIFFPSESQRATFIASIEKAKGEEKTRVVVNIDHDGFTHMSLKEFAEKLKPFLP